MASLCKKFGVEQLAIIEDAVQFAMLQAIEHWPYGQEPDNPSAWLYTVAYRHCLSNFDAARRQGAILTKHAVDIEHSHHRDQAPPLKGEMNDDLLRLLFVSCAESIPLESQLIFTLKTLCGFSFNDITQRLFISEANAYKRFARAKKSLTAETLTPDQLSDAQLTARLPAVHKVLYLLFNEGYLSVHPTLAIRQELCNEALRLATLLCESRIGNTPSSKALTALMHLHCARLNAREKDGALVLFEQQNQQAWDSEHIEAGLCYLSEAAEGETITRYHIEAGIAAEYCLAPSFGQIRWQKIAEAYALLEQVAPSPLHRLARALALAQWQGPKSALALLAQFSPPPWLMQNYYWYAVMADLHYRTSDNSVAETYAAQAMQSAPTQAIKEAINQRFNKYQ